MSTTIPTEFVGEPTLTPEKVETFKEWYCSNLWDADKADDEEALLEYTVGYEVMEGVLRLLHDMPLDDNQPVSVFPYPPEQVIHSPLLNDPVGA